MFRVTPVPEASKERKVSFSPDIDESYRHEVVGKIKNLMEEVSVSFFPSHYSFARIFFSCLFYRIFFPSNTQIGGTTESGLPGPRYKIQHLLELKTTVDFQHRQKITKYHLLQQSVD